MKIVHVALALGLAGGVLKAQNFTSESLHKDARNIAVWGEGGASVAGGVEDSELFSAGVRIGRVLTNELGSGILRGNFEYGVDLIPLTIIQAPNTVYGAGVAPVNLKWNFTGAKRIAPYFELNGGVLFTASEVPPDSSKVNFTSGATAGVYVFTRKGRALELAAKFQHISNAGLDSVNPGINIVHFRIGFHWFK